MFRHILCPSSGVLYCTFGTDKLHAGFDDRFHLCPSSGVLYSTFGTGKLHVGFDDRFQAESGWNPRSSILTLLGNGHQNLHATYQCRM